MILPSSNWDWLVFLAMGTLILLSAYRVMGMGDETFYKKYGRLMKLGGYSMILFAAYLFLERFLLPRWRP